MNDLKNIISKYNFNVNKYKKKGNLHILDTNKGVFCLKKKKRKDISDVLAYLKAKQFNNILEFLSDEDDEYEITRYIQEINLLDEDKAMEAIYLISMLHNKTTFYKSISLDEVKCFYEKQTDNIANLKSYFDNLCYIFDEKLFISPSQYLFIRNITVLYNALDYSKYYIDKWYNIMKNKTTKRVAMNHNNLDLSHVISSDNTYFINWNKATIDVPIMDLYIFFRNNFLNIDVCALFDVYTSKYQLLKEEYFLLFSLLLIPLNFEFIDCEIENTKMVYDNYKYLSTILSFVSKYDLENNKEKCY